MIVTSASDRGEDKTGRWRLSFPAGTLNFFPLHGRNPIDQWPVLSAFGPDRHRDLSRCRRPGAARTHRRLCAQSSQSTGETLKFNNDNVPRVCRNGISRENCIQVVGRPLIVVRVGQLHCHSYTLLHSENDNSTDPTGTPRGDGRPSF